MFYYKDVEEECFAEYLNYYFWRYVGQVKRWNINYGENGYGHVLIFFHIDVKVLVITGW